MRLERPRSPDIPEDDAPVYFGVETGNHLVRRFKLYLRSGRRLSIPYASLPVIELSAEQDLLIRTHDMRITVKGRNLEGVADWLSEEKLLFMKEAISGHDTGDSEVFIADILLRGNLLD